MSKPILVVPAQIQIHLDAGDVGHHIGGAPPWADEAKLKQWGDSVEAILRQHACAHGLHLIILPLGVLCEYCRPLQMSEEIDAKLQALTPILIDALLTARETVEAQQGPSFILA